MLVQSVIAPALEKAEQAFESALNEVTIDALCRNAEREGLSDGKSTADFNI
jgi:hypothetical protein